MRFTSKFPDGFNDDAHDWVVKVIQWARTLLAQE